MLRSRRVTSVDPVSAIATRISASMMLEHARDAGAALRGERIGPGAAEQHALRAEREHAHDVEAGAHAAVGEHGQRSPHGIGDRGQGGAVDITPSSWRPPWLETMMPSAPSLAASRGILGVEDALDDRAGRPSSRG